MGKIWIVLFSVLLLWSCSQTKTEYKEPEKDGFRIISLAQSVTQELIELGVEDQIVGATSYCSVTKYRKDLVVGSATEVNLEKVLLLKPDIVFATGLTKASTIDAMTKNGIDVYSIGKLNSFEKICKEMLVIGEKVNQKQKAIEIVEAAKLKISELRKSIPVQEELEEKTAESEQTVFFQLGTQPLFSVIPNTFMNEFITLADCENIAKDLEHGSITRESVLTRNPDVIFVVTMGVVGVDEQDVWRKYPELKAVKNDKIFVIDADIACTPSVGSFVKSLEIVIDSIY